MPERPQQHIGCPTVVTPEARLSPASPHLTGSQGSCLPTRTMVTGMHLNCPHTWPLMAKEIIVPKAKHDPHSSHLHHSPSCNAPGIYALTTLTIIPGQHTWGRHRHCQHWNFTGHEDILIWNKGFSTIYLLLSQSCRNLTAKCKPLVQCILTKKILIMPPNSKRNS